MKQNKLQRIALTVMTAVAPATLLATLPGAGTAEDPFRIASAEDFLQIADNYAASYLLTGDIDLTGTTFEGFGEDFTGVLDGDNHTIKGMNILKRGIFQNLKENGKICDLTLDSPTYTPSGWMWSGGVVGAMEGSVDDNFTPVISGVKVVNPKVESETFQMYWGGIAGWATKQALIEDCAVTGADISLPKAMVGGIVGEAPGPAKFYNCYFSGTIFGNVVAGICCDYREGEMLNCYVDAELACAGNCGGLVANLSWMYEELPRIENCFVKASIEADVQNTNIGGLIGKMPLDSKAGGLKGCIVAKLTLNNNASGSENSHRIAGVNIPEEATTVTGITDCYVIEPAQPLKADMAAEANNPEGATMEALTQEEMEKIGFRFGTDSENPWNFNEGEPTLYYFAKVNSVDAIAEAVDMAVVGSSVVANGCLISAYSTDGVLVASGNDYVELPAGLNLVVVNNGGATKAVKVLVR